LFLFPYLTRDLSNPSSLIDWLSLGRFTKRAFFLAELDDSFEDMLQVIAFLSDLTEGTP